MGHCSLSKKTTHFSRKTALPLPPMSQIPATAGTMCTKSCLRLFKLGIRFIYNWRLRYINYLTWRQLFTGIKRKEKRLDEGANVRASHYAAGSVEFNTKVAYLLCHTSTSILVHTDPLHSQFIAPQIWWDGTFWYYNKSFFYHWERLLCFASIRSLICVSSRYTCTRRHTMSVHEKLQRGIVAYCLLLLKGPFIGTGSAIEISRWTCTCTCTCQSTHQTLSYKAYSAAWNIPKSKRRFYCYFCFCLCRSI